MQQWLKFFYGALTVTELYGEAYLEDVEMLGQSTERILMSCASMGVKHYNVVGKFRALPELLRHLLSNKVLLNQN